MRNCKGDFLKDSITNASSNNSSGGCGSGGGAGAVAGAGAGAGANVYRFLFVVAFRGQKSSLVLKELQLHVAVNFLISVLGTDLRSST